MSERFMEVKKSLDSCMIENMPSREHDQKVWWRWMTAQLKTRGGEVRCKIIG